MPHSAPIEGDIGRRYRRAAEGTMPSDSPVFAAKRRSSGLRIAAVAAGLMLAPCAAPAFTIDDGSDGSTPKFDLEEQSRNFRTQGADLSTPAKREIETPYGTMHFGVQRDSLFGSPAGSRADRRYMDRMLTPQQFDR
jgi:hypothetical protein